MRAAARRWIPFAAPRWSHFAPPLTLIDKDEIRQALLRYVGRAGENLRRGGLMAVRITVFARTDRFNPARPCYSRMLTTTLPFPTDSRPP